MSGGSGEDHEEELDDWSVATTLVHGSSGTTAGDGIWSGTSNVVSALAKEEDCSSSEGTVVSSGGAGGDNVGCTGAEGTVGATGKGSSSMS